MHVQMRVQLHPSNGNKQTPRDDDYREEFNSHHRSGFIGKSVSGRLRLYRRRRHGKEISIYEETMREKRRKLIERI